LTHPMLLKSSEEVGEISEEKMVLTHQIMLTFSDDKPSFLSIVHSWNVRKIDPVELSESAECQGIIHTLRSSTSTDSRSNLLQNQNLLCCYWTKTN